MIIETQMPSGFRKIHPICCKTCKYSKIGLEFHRGNFVDWKCEHPDSDGQVLDLYKQNPMDFTCDKWNEKIT